MMGQGCTSAHLPGQEQSSVDKCVTSPASLRPSSETHSSGEAGAIEKFEEELSRKIAQGIKGLTQVQPLLSSQAFHFPF
jgi:hypothetical protein